MSKDGKLAHPLSATSSDRHISIIGVGKYIGIDKATPACFACYDGDFGTICFGCEWGLLCARKTAGGD